MGRRAPEPKVAVVCSCGWKGRRVAIAWDAAACPRSAGPKATEGEHLLAGPEPEPKPAKKAARRKPKRPLEGVPPATERELEELRGAPQDLPPGRQGTPVTLALTAEQAPDLAEAYAHYRHRFPKATEGDLVAWLLREYRRAEGLLG